MQFNFSAGGVPADVRRAVELQVQQQALAMPSHPGRDEFADAILGFVAQQLDDVEPASRVSVSGLVSIHVARPPRASRTAAAEVPAE